MIHNEIAISCNLIKVFIWHKSDQP